MIVLFQFVNYTDKNQLRIGYFMSKFISKIILLSALSSGSIYAFASDQDDAITACTTAIQAAIQKNDPFSKNLDFNVLCKNPEHNASEWNCVATGVTNGNNIIYSEHQCFYVAKKMEPDLSAGASEKGIEACKQAADAFTQRKPDAQVDFLCNSNTNIHNPKEWGCVLTQINGGSDFNYAMEQCLINQPVN